MEYFVFFKDKKFTVEIDNGVDAPDTVKINGKKRSVDYQILKSPNHVSLIIDGIMHEIEFEEENTQLKAQLNSREAIMRVETFRDQMVRRFAESDIQDAGTANIAAPMPGLVVKVLKKVGDKVAKGEGIIIVEAMKMENEVKSSKNGVVDQIKIKEGDKVDKLQVLAIIK